MRERLTQGYSAYNGLLAKHIADFGIIHRFRKKPEVALKRGLVANQNRMADGTGESHERFEKKRKRYENISCAAAKCNNWSDNRPDLSYHAFPLDVETRKKCEEVTFLSRVLTTNFVVQSISFPFTLQ